MFLFSKQCLIQNFHRMEGLSPKPVFNLMTARSTWGGHNHLIFRLAKRWIQNQFRYLLRNRIVFLFVTERTRHTTTTRWDDFYLIVHRKGQYLPRGLHQFERFLITVSVQTNLFRLSGKLFWMDPSRFPFLQKEFIDKQRMLSDPLGFLP